MNSIQYVLSGEYDRDKFLHMLSTPTTLIDQIWDTAIKEYPHMINAWAGYGH